MNFYEIIGNIDVAVNDFLQFLLNPGSSSWFLTIKFIFLSLNLFFILFIVYALINTKWIKRLVIWDMIEYLTFRSHAVSRIDKDWAKIEARFSRGAESDAKLALIEADTVLNDVLQAQGYSGDTLTDKLQKLSIDIMENLPEVKKAHETTSNIIHDPTYHLSMNEAKSMIDVYEKALIDLQAL